jgi:cell division septum initiation protein DivIVA
MSKALKKLTIEHLRGSVTPFTLPFEKVKKLTVIYGENGTGKTTICDAFDFIGNGKVGSLENRGLGRTNRYWQTLGKTPADIAVALETATTVCKARIGRSDVTVSPLEHRPRVEILRRGQILSLVEAKPAERYAAISRFIDVTAIEQSEATLRGLIRETEERQKVSLARVQENRETIQQFWETTGKPGTNSMEWAESEARRDEGVSDAELTAISDLTTSFSRLTDLPERIKTSEKMLKDATDSLALAQKTFDNYLNQASADAAEMVSILEAAKAYLERQPTPSVCPLCESAEKVEDLAGRVSERITAFATLQQARNTKTEREKARQKAIQQLELLQDTVHKQAKEFEECRARHTWPEDVLLPGTAVPEDIAELSLWLSKHAKLPGDWKKAESVRQDKKQFLATLRKAVKTCTENTAALKEIDMTLPRLKEALEISEGERRRFTDATLKRIADEVGRLYETVHPGEGLDKISLALDPDKRASLEMGASFCGKTGTPPQAYFSDSHLDTLGLCVFLALAALDKPAETILVLDDVLASVDEPHVGRLIEMIYSEAMKFRHCVITTHYRPWKYKLRWGWLKTGQCQFVELAKWSSLEGITIIRTVPDIQRLKELLAESSPDPQLVCAKAGYILEAALNFLTLLYECSAPRKPEDRYTIGDLLPAISKKLREALRVDVLKGNNEKGEPMYETISLAPIVDELTRIAEARNAYGAHFKELSFELLDSDGLAFAKQVVMLMEVLTDEDGCWPRNADSGEYWATSGGTRRLHPLKRPS